MLARSLALLIIGLLVLPSATVAAISTQDLQSINNNTSFFGHEDTTSCSTDNGMPVDSTLPGSIPEAWAKIISPAAAKFNTNANLVAAILYWENRAFPDPQKQWAVSSAGAEGPMQFLPTTFKSYCTRTGMGCNITSVQDAVYAAALLLSANYTGSWDTALLSYNHSAKYVATVDSIAASIN